MDIHTLPFALFGEPLDVIAGIKAVFKDINTGEATFFQLGGNGISDKG